MSDTDNQERIGVHAVGLIVEHELGWIFREQSTSDYGIDALIEERGPDGKPTGKLVALQIKSGPSYFKPKGAGYVYYGEKRHLRYWANHSLPVFIILHNPETQTTLWQKVDRGLIEETRAGWSIFIPQTNTLDASAKRYFENQSTSTPDAARRLRMASDLANIRLFIEQGEIYCEINDWVNKTLNIREVGIYFKEYGKEKFDLKIPYWGGPYTVFEFMTEAFPWLDYEHVESEETLGGEVEVHTLRVWVNDLGKAFAAVEDYFENGPLDREEPDLLPGEDRLDKWIRRAIAREMLNS